MKRLVLVLTIFFGLATGCTAKAPVSPVPMNVVMTNPATGESIYIANTHYNTGNITRDYNGHLEAMKQQKLAIEGAKMRGFTEMKVVGE